MAANVVSAIRTFVRGMRASWHFGGATRTVDPASALRQYGRVLDLIRPDCVDVEAPWCRGIIPFALVGFCDAAQKVGQPHAASAALAR